MGKPQTKAKFKLRNWSAYNAALVNRGRLTLWISEEVTSGWRKAVQTGKPGHPFEYADAAIECLLIIKEVLHLPLRQTEGLGLSLMKMMKLDLAVPDYTTLCRRRPELRIVFPRQRESEHLHVVVDATGLKVYGDGEWNARRKQPKRRRTWLKLHLAFDEATGEVLACVVTDKNEHDKTMLPDVLEQIEETIDQVSADKGYDYMSCYDAIAEREARAVIPPRRSARIWDNGQMDARDANLRRIASVGREAWKEESEYHRRSLAENGIYRLKIIFGPQLSSRKPKAQTVEACIRCAALNRMTALGMPDAYPVI